jgi:hypothetical protein
MSAVIWHLPDGLLDASISIMKPHGEQGNEGLALWLGTIDDEERAIVSHVVALHGSGFATSPLHMRLSLRAMAALTEMADRLGVYLLGQIHSHPGSFTELSEVDKECGMRTNDFLSVVCPHYAQRTDTTLDDCGIHVFENGGFRRLNAIEVTRRLICVTSKFEVVHHEMHRD